jgi:hypothetical protein
MDACSAWNCDLPKFTTKFPLILSSETKFHARFIQKTQRSTVAISDRIYTQQNNNQYLTLCWKQLHCSVNNFSGNCC